MKLIAATAAATAVAMIAPATALAANYQIGPVSQQEGPSRASVGAGVRLTSSASSSPGVRDVSAEEGEPSAGPSSEAEDLGPRRANGESCQELPASASPCFGVVALPPEAEAKEAAPPVNPAAIAAAAASRLSLLAGRIEASPSSRTAGLTGAASWFWLSPAPTTQSLAVGVRREHVTVTAAVGAVRWDFGDGAITTGGPGVAYSAGSTPPAAIRHAYETRCLPGDRGHDPNVLPSCGPNGYEVHAAIEWRVSFQATGPVAAGGALPARSTEATLTYPVSEARAFLTKASPE